MLFDDNFGFVGFNFIDNMPIKKKESLTSVENGFASGNMFEDLYKPYKDYKYLKPVAKNPKDELLLEIMALSFAINDIELYLDLNPNDEDMLKKFRMLVEKSCQKEMEYIKNYGPLELIDDDKKNNFTWVKNPWPWDHTGGTSYV